MRLYVRVGNSVKYTSLVLSLQASERLCIQQNKKKNIDIFAKFNLSALQSYIVISGFIESSARTLDFPEGTRETWQ